MFRNLGHLFFFFFIKRANVSDYKTLLYHHSFFVDWLTKQIMATEGLLQQNLEGEKLRLVQMFYFKRTLQNNQPILRWMFTSKVTALN